MKYMWDSGPIFHLNLDAKRCWIHSAHCALSGVKYLLLLEATLAMKSMVEGEHKVGVHSFVW